MEYLRPKMDKNKQTAVGILILLGTILVLMTTWDVPEKALPEK
jgi:hypothetical protein